MAAYTLVRDETPSVNLMGAAPWVRARNGTLGAFLLERRTDGKLFLNVRGTTCAQQAREWADRVIAEW